MRDQSVACHWSSTDSGRIITFDHVEEWEGEGVSLTDTYEVEDIGAETLMARCRRCGRTWEAFAEAPRGWWRYPASRTSSAELEAWPRAFGNLQFGAS